MRHAPPPRFVGDWQGEANVHDLPSAHSTISFAPETRASHVLVVDDDRAMRDMIVDYLIAQDIRVSTAADSLQIVQAIEAGGIDLIVLDLTRGHASGFDIVRSLRSVSD